MESNYLKKNLQDYEVISVLGSGSFGTCYKVRDKETQNIYAWKSVDYDEFDETNFKSLLSEINVLRQLKHSNIVRYYHHLISVEAKSVFIIMEWCENGDLNHLIARARLEQKRFEEQYIWRVLYQICKALQVCHSKLKQGTILHRDIKPANIFLDANWNAKLGDFGLARLIQRSERFVKSFVGTPYYMSPELLKNGNYDVKSDVWSLGCLVYEMSALRQPFKGKRMQQLSSNIKLGNYENISSVYTHDLQEIIKSLLNNLPQERPCVDTIARHPNVLKNIKNLKITTKPLIDAERDFYETCKLKGPRTQLHYSLSSSGTDDSFYDFGRNSHDVSGVFTPDLRYEIFYSANRRLYSRTLQQSDSELYKTARRETNKLKNSIKSPKNLTQNIFHEHLKERLHGIRAHEALLKQKEDELNEFEKKLFEKERRLLDLQKKLDSKQNNLEQKIKIFKQNNRRSNFGAATQTTATKRISLTASLERKSHDDTYCSIEQDTISPTVAKLNLKTLPVTKSLSNLRKVTFQSPKQIINYNIENIPPTSTAQHVSKKTLRNSIGSSDSSNSDGTNQRRKSFLSLFGIKRKDAALNELQVEPNIPKAVQSKTEILLKCEPTKLSSVWTNENKRAAFNLLAAMNNATETSNKNSTKQLSCTDFRQSMRDHSRNALRRERLRQSMRVFP